MRERASVFKLASTTHLMHACAHTHTSAHTHTHTCTQNSNHFCVVSLDRPWKPVAPDWLIGSPMIGWPNQPIQEDDFKMHARENCIYACIICVVHALCIQCFRYAFKPKKCMRYINKCIYACTTRVLHTLCMQCFRYASKLKKLHAWHQKMHPCMHNTSRACIMHPVFSICM